MLIKKEKNALENLYFFTYLIHEIKSEWKIRLVFLLFVRFVVQKADYGAATGLSKHT